MSTRKSELTLKIAVLSVALLLYTTSMTTPAIGAIAKAFPDVSPEVVKQIASLPPLLMILGSLLAGQLVRFIRKKTILYMAMVVEFLFGGIIPAFYGDIAFILFCRAIFGIGYGLVFPIASSLVADFFEGQERDNLMGIKSAIGAAAGVIFQMVGGYLAFIYWRYAFWGFLLLIPIFLIIAILLPEPENKLAMVESHDNSPNRLTPRIWFIALMNLLYNIVQFTFMTNVAIVMAEGKIGSAAHAGFVLMVFTGGAFVAGIFYGKIAKIFGQYTTALAVGLVGLAFSMLIKVHTYPLFLAAGVIFGLGFGIYNPRVILLVVGSSHKSAVTLALSVYIALQGVGQFLSPIVCSFVTGLLGLRGPHAAWIVAGPTLLLVCVFIILATALIKPKCKAIGDC